MTSKPNRMSRRQHDNARAEVDKALASVQRIAVTLAETYGNDSRRLMQAVKQAESAVANLRVQLMLQPQDEYPAENETQNDFRADDASQNATSAAEGSQEQPFVMMRANLLASAENAPERAQDVLQILADLAPLLKAMHRMMEKDAWMRLTAEWQRRDMGDRAELDFLIGDKWPKLLALAESLTIRRADSDKELAK